MSMSRRRKIIRTLLGFLPQVQRPNQPIPHCVKYFYTVASVFIFMAAGQLPLYGDQPAPRGPDPLYWARLPFAANWGTLMTFGIHPVILPEAIVHVLGRPALDMNSIYTEDRTILDGAQKLLGIFITMLIAIGFALFSVILDKVGTAIAVLIMLQVFFSGVAVIYLDEVLKKGYGLLPSTSLFTATNICANVMWKAFSPSYVINLLSACLFCLIAVFVQGFSVVLPMRLDGILQVNYRLKLSHISYAPIIFQRVVLLLMVSISEMLYVIFGESSPVNLFGKWKESNTPFEKSSPFSGIVYYLKAPPTLVDVQRDPLHAFLYISIVLYTCPLFSAIRFRVCMTCRTFYNGLLGANGEPRLTRAQPDLIPQNEFWSYIYGAASLGGLCVGALIVLADFVGVAGSGTGIMLAVTAVSRYFEGWKAEQPGILGL